jgi:hypothetical protein
MEHVGGLHPCIGRNLSSELGELQEHVARVRAGHAIEGEQQSWLTMAICDALVDLNMLPIQGIPTQPQSVKGVLMVFRLVLEWLRVVAPAHGADT